MTLFAIGDTIDVFREDAVVEQGRRIIGFREVPVAETDRTEMYVLLLCSSPAPVGAIRHSKEKVSGDYTMKDFEAYANLLRRAQSGTP
jgi:hypothetical protein